ncbi:MAG: hypothetical protein OEX77_00840 [Candidatus Bathyarchaeota archaeon]|nr:hypothetical protein [Candidatus Bathyarchaeota archaeon]MDH5732445.1 hypothetical protein [Candidatus Bathyarchaeota archaeon]
MKWNKNEIGKPIEKEDFALDSRLLSMMRKFRPVRLLDTVQELLRISSDVKSAMLEAERRKAETLNVVRLKETFT